MVRHKYYQIFRFALLNSDETLFCSMNKSLLWVGLSTLLIWSRISKKKGSIIRTLLNKYKLHWTFDLFILNICCANKNSLGRPMIIFIIRLLYDVTYAYFCHVLKRVCLVCMWWVNKWQSRPVTLSIATLSPTNIVACDVNKGTSERRSAVAGSRVSFSSSPSWLRRHELSDINLDFHAWH